MPPTGPPLPRVGQKVDLWFSGYDDYYAGRVSAITTPDTFDVTLDDGSTWPVDRINNIWKLRGTPATTTPPPTTPSKTTPRKRHTGKALRKSTPATGRVGLGATNPRPTATPATTPSTTTPNPTVASPVPSVARRSTRSRADIVTPNHPVRRGRPRGSTNTPSVGVKRAKRRRVGADTDPEAHPDAQADGAVAGAGGGTGGAGPLSMQAVTAIAVDAALASAKAVLRPLGDKLNKVGEEMAVVHDGVKEAYDELVRASAGGRPGKRGAVMAEGAVSQAALDALLLDLSELIGGGEARIRAYEQMSDTEIEAFRKALKDNAKAMQQLDQVLGERRSGGAGAGAGAGGRPSRRTRRG